MGTGYCADEKGWSAYLITHHPSPITGFMKCPFCNSPDTQVIDSRVSDDGDSIRRRRKCAACSKRFTTYETVELRMPQVVKQDGSRA